ncbi:malonyl-ACP O-methyltransferase BioC [Marinagarivorans algicola]|uniref:malonyl-ACP O-methyltransferase BioC n=1 Tax=Marinagarivorans algicola TaxID=1513270 RepID=UPI0006B4293E|nr:malonyl-ACP O-methyltransferase BioC [Marinagarivorans algicola]
MNSTRRLQTAKKGEPILVCIHGWAANAQVWSALVNHVNMGVFTVDLPGFGDECASVPSCDDFVAHLVTELKALNVPIHQTYLVGWSLGGQVAALLAQQLAAQGLSIAGLVTIASNPCFVAQSDWPSAMPEADFIQFQQHFATQPALTLKRFVTLQATGGQNVRELRAAQRALLPSAPLLGSHQHTLWCHTLEWLQQDTRDILKHLKPPQLHVLAQHDALVPAQTPLGQFGEALTLAHSSHCLPLEAPQKIARAITIFIKTHQQQALNKRKVAEAFSVAASRYDAFARVQKTVAKQVLKQLPCATDAVVLDIGCGTGALTQGVFNDWQPAHVLAVDIAQGMLRFARSRSRCEAVRYIAADAESLPIASQSIDGIMSSLAIQWCEMPAVLMHELYRVLKPGGWAVIATLGPGTLAELKTAWQAVDECVHVNAFTSRALLEQACLDAGFATTLTQQTAVCDYPSLMPLLKELKAIGAHNSHTNAPAGLMTRARLQQLEQNYPIKEGQKAPIVASYDVFYLVLYKPG